VLKTIPCEYVHECFDMAPAEYLQRLEENIETKEDQGAWLEQMYKTYQNWKDAGLQHYDGKEAAQAKQLEDGKPAVEEAADKKRATEAHGTIASEEEATRAAEEDAALAKQLADKEEESATVKELADETIALKEEAARAAEEEAARAKQLADEEEQLAEEEASAAEKLVTNKEESASEC
jgi:hypothetical protein